LPTNKTQIAARREQLRNTYWPGEDAWTGDDEKGWFRAPRTLPLILGLLKSKRLSGRLDPSSVYLELLARHRGEGVIEMSAEADHAYAAGYASRRGTPRSWPERMRLLEKLGFIRIQSIGNQKYKYVLIVHPATVIERLKKQNLVPGEWWDAYRDRKLETKEESYDERMKRLKKVTSIASPQGKKAKAG
jgi:hypothetical protein